MDEESERKKLSDMGLTDDVIEVVLEKKENYYESKLNR